MSAYMNKLVHNRGTTRYRPVANLNLPCYTGVSYHDHVIAYLTVVRHVNISHQQTVVPDDGLSFCTCPPVQGSELPDCGVVSYFYGGFLTHKLQVLRIADTEAPLKMRQFFPILAPSYITA